MALLKRILRALPLLVASPFLVAIAALTLAFTDLAWLLFGRRKACAGQARPAPTAASVVIPNWNGKGLLEKYLPSVVEALAGNPANEIVVVDNGSTDGSAEFLRSAFPRRPCWSCPKTWASAAVRTPACAPPGTKSWSC